MELHLNEHQNQEELFKINRQQRLKVLQNTFQLIQWIETAVILTQLFILSFYQLYTPSKTSALWISYYYSCYLAKCFFNNNLCSEIQGSQELYNFYCGDEKQLLNYLRYFLSGIVIVIIILMTIDVWRILTIKNQLKENILTQELVNKAKKYQISITIALIFYYVVLLLFIFFLEGNWDCQLGSAFYIGAAGALAYLIIIVFYRYTKGRFTRANLFEILLNKELQTSGSELDQEFKSFDISGSEKFYSLDQ